MITPSDGGRKVEEILSRVRISEVYKSLTGAEPRRAGRDTWRGPAAWRGGDSPDSVSGDDARGVWHDFPTDQGGGILDLIVTARGGDRAAALQWLADFVGMPLDDRPLSQAERAEWVAERREIERFLPVARLWRRAAVNMATQVQDAAKAALFDPSVSPAPVQDIADMERLVRRLNRLDGTELISEYREWATAYPRLTEVMVKTARTREAAERRALLAYLQQTNPERSAA